MIPLTFAGIVIGWLLYMFVPVTGFVQAKNDWVKTQAIIEVKQEPITPQPIMPAVIVDTDEVRLVNKYRRLSSEYEPEDLTEIYDICLRQAAANALADMLYSAQSDHIYDLVPYSGYRSYSLQSIVYNNKIARLRDRYGEDAETEAQQLVAPPGASEHQTGLAVDFTLREFLDYEYVLNYDFADTAPGKWLRENSWRYGYILRYQEEKSGKTMIAYEPWHFRYVGKEHAKRIFETNLCLEEYHEIILRH